MQFVSLVPYGIQDVYHVPDWLRYLKLLMQNYCMGSRQTCQKCSSIDSKSAGPFQCNWTSKMAAIACDQLRHILLFLPKLLRMKSQDLSRIVFQMFHRSVHTCQCDLKSKMAILGSDWPIYFVPFRIHNKYRQQKSTMPNLLHPKSHHLASVVVCKLLHLDL